jgi:hypothetical protein
MNKQEANEARARRRETREAAGWELARAQARAMGSSSAAPLGEWLVVVVVGVEGVITVVRAHTPRHATRADSGVATQQPPPPVAAVSALPVMPELEMTADGQLDLGCQAEVLRAIDKVLRWLGASAQAHQQLWHRFWQWLPVHGVRAYAHGLRAFKSAYVMLQDAVSTGERAYIASVLNRDWGVNV